MEAIERLVRDGADVDVKDGLGETPLMRLSARIDLVRGLLALGAVVDGRQPPGGETPLMLGLRTLSSRPGRTPICG